RCRAIVSRGTLDLLHFLKVLHQHISFLFIIKPHEGTRAVAEYELNPHIAAPARIVHCEQIEVRRYDLLIAER
ncbi:MAG: hypothetical protein WCS11_06345, partial [Dysgonamonadaceae bacterium]